MAAPVWEEGKNCKQTAGYLRDELAAGSKVPLARRETVKGLSEASAAWVAGWGERVEGWLLTAAEIAFELWVRTGEDEGGAERTCRMNRCEGPRVCQW